MNPDLAEFYQCNWNTSSSIWHNWSRDDEIMLW